LTGCKIEDKGLEALSGVLQSFTCLRTFKLAIADEVTDEGLEALGESLSKLSLLEIIILSFENCPIISDEGMNNLGECLKKLYSLRIIGLRFSWDGIERKAKNDLMKNLRRLGHIDNIQIL